MINLKQKPSSHPLISESQIGQIVLKPIGITSVEIMNVSKDYLEVRGLDAIDGTPVIDIKPYYPMFDSVDSPKVPGWVHRLMENYFLAKSINQSNGNFQNGGN